MYLLGWLWIGYWLLLWPCWWSLALAGREHPAGWSYSLVEGNGWPDPILLVLFYVGAIAMRAAGCAYNDIIDRDIDKMVKRTVKRPIASGQIGSRQAALFCLTMSFLGFLVLLTFNLFTILLALASLILVGLYPFMKRVTYYPQLILGLAFNWGALLGWAALTGTIHPAAIALYISGVSWTLGYDTIYAHQDKDEDQLLGVKSLAIKLGQNTRKWLAIFYTTTVLGLLAAGWLSDVGWVFYWAMIPCTIQLARQVINIDISSAENCLEKFRSNHALGALVFASLVLGNVT